MPDLLQIKLNMLSRDFQITLDQNFLYDYGIFFQKMKQLQEKILWLIEICMPKYMPVQGDYKYSPEKICSGPRAC